MDYYGNFTGDVVPCRSGLKIPITGVPTLPPTSPPPPPTGKPGEPGPPGEQVQFIYNLSLFSSNFWMDIGGFPKFKLCMQIHLFFPPNLPNPVRNKIP